MKKRCLYGVALCAVLVAGVPIGTQALDQERARDRERLQVETQEQAYGWQIMTEQERLQYHERMRSMHSEEERQQFRQEHHLRMQERAREMGVDMPESPHGPKGPPAPSPRGGKGGKSK